MTIPVVDQLDSIVSTLAGAIGKPEGKIKNLSNSFCRSNPLDALHVYGLPLGCILESIRARDHSTTLVLLFDWNPSPNVYVSCSVLPHTCNDICGICFDDPFAT